MWTIIVAPPTIKYYFRIVQGYGMDCEARVLLALYQTPSERNQTRFRSILPEASAA